MKEQDANEGVCSSLSSLTFYLLTPLDLPSTSSTLQLVDNAPLTILTPAGACFQHCRDDLSPDRQQQCQQTVGTFCDSLSNEILKGNDVCLPSYETFSENNSLEKVVNNDSPSLTVGFFDSNHSRANTLDISFSLNVTNEHIGANSSKKNKVYECSICSRIFDRPTSLIVHNRKHNGQKPYQCMICGRTFSQTSNVKRHVETHKVYPHFAHKSATGSISNHLCTEIVSPTIDLLELVNYTIEPCSFKTSKEISEQMSFAFTCPYCKKLFDCSKCRKSHLPTHRDRKVFQCTLRSCRQLIATLEEYLSHVKIHDGNMIYTCPICQKQCRSLNQIGIHQSTHVFDRETKTTTKRRTFCCFVCGAVFKTLENFERHQSSSSHSYACRRCPRVYSSDKQLRRHMKICHSNREKLQCTVCNKIFSHPYCYKVHCRRHIAIVQPCGDVLKCKQCYKTFGRQDSLRRHVNSVHSTAAVSVRCSFEGCSKTFKRMDRLKEHVLTHNLANRKYECATCGKTFLRKRSRTLHVSSVHLKTYRLHCEKCNKGFNRPDCLKKHLTKCS